MKKKFEIQVRTEGTDTKPSVVIGTIRRVLVGEQMGNFNPVFCTYQEQRYLVKSTEGDISDPFRRDETYLKTLYIEVKK